MSAFVWLLDEYVNHRLPRRLFSRRLCDFNDRLLMDGGRWVRSNIAGRQWRPPSTAP